MATRIEFGKFMVHLQTALPKYAPDVSKQYVVDVWFDALSLIEVEELRAVYKYCIDTLDAFPSIKLIKELANRNIDDGWPKDPLRALVDSASRNPQDVHPGVTALAERLGGWKVVGQWPIDSYDFKRKHISELWQQIKYESLNGSKPETILLEIENAEKGIQSIPVFDEPMNRTDEGMKLINSELAALRASLRQNNKQQRNHA